MPALLPGYQANFETLCRAVKNGDAALMDCRLRTKVGGFGIADKDDLLFVEDVQLVKQDCSLAYVSFDDESVADYFDAQVDQGRKPEQFARLWIHTHPGNSPLPSGTDEQTFERVFGRAQWAVMFIVAREGQTYARLRFNVGPSGEMEIPAEVDYSRPFPACDRAAWEREYLTNVVSEDDFQAAPHANADEAMEAFPVDLNDPFFVEDSGRLFEQWPDDEIAAEQLPGFQQ